MSLSDRLEKALNADTEQRREDPNYRRMEEFLERAAQAGMSDAPRYGIPPVDTIGRRPYEQIAELAARSDSRR